jgi:aspartokinase
MLATNQKSITQAVREMVSSDLSFQDSLQRNYCNISALARLIKPQIDNMLGKDISIDIAKVSAKKSKKTIEKVAKAMVQSAGNFISISESIMSITLAFDDLLLQDVKVMFSYDDILEIENGLAAIIIHSPEDIIKTPGCAIAFYNQLARRHINIEDTVSCYTDTIVLVKMEQVGKAFNALTDLISNSRKMVNKKHR